MEINYFWLHSLTLPMSLITLLQTKKQRSAELIADSLSQLKSFEHQRHSCLPDSYGVTVIWAVMWVWASTAQVNKTVATLGILQLADEFFAEDINAGTHAQRSSHTSVSDVRHMRDAIIM